MTVNILKTTGDSCAHYGTWTCHKRKLILDVRYWHIRRPKYASSCRRREVSEPMAIIRLDVVEPRRGIRPIIQLSENFYDCGIATTRLPAPS